MNYCLICGQKLLKSYNFCPKCGAQIKITEDTDKIVESKKCSKCGFANMIENTFCVQCGADLRDLLMEDF